MKIVALLTGKGGSSLKNKNLIKIKKKEFLITRAKLPKTSKLFPNFMSRVKIKKF